MLVTLDTCLPFSLRSFVLFHLHPVSFTQHPDSLAEISHPSSLWRFEICFARAMMYFDYIQCSVVIDHKITGSHCLKIPITSALVNSYLRSELDPRVIVCCYFYLFREMKLSKIKSGMIQMVCFISKRQLLIEIVHLNQSFSSGVTGIRKAPFALPRWFWALWHTPTAGWPLILSPPPTPASRFTGSHACTPPEFRGELLPPDSHAPIFLSDLFPLDMGYCYFKNYGSFYQFVACSMRSHSLSCC